MILSFYLLLICLSRLAASHRYESDFYNPILPGWNSDPSCMFAPEANDTFFCTTSSFLAFPGLPVYASKDLRTWALISNALHHPSQFPEFRNTPRPDEGIFAPTLRFHRGQFYLITVFYAPSVGIFKTLLFKTRNPFDHSAWSGPFEITTLGYDPDLFWDDDGKAYLTASRSSYGGIVQAPIDLTTGELLGQQYSLWNGTGGSWPEGPHLYRKDGFYYLTIAEGGISVDHMQTIARSRHIRGPYTSYERNPIVTNRNTSEYFQTVGHADFFQSASGDWFGVALATRSGPEWTNFPMGRETVLFSVTWEKGQWPQLDPVRGIMDGSTLPPRSRWLPHGTRAVDGPDIIDFAPGSSIPKHLVHWSLPEELTSYTVSPKNQPFSLRLYPSKTNLTGNLANPAAENRTFIARRQTHSLFTFEADIQYNPTKGGEEAGITVFLTPQQHLDLGITRRDNNSRNPELIFRVIDIEIRPLPKRWREDRVRLQIQAVNETTYRFAARAHGSREYKDIVFYGSATVVSAGAGHFTGSLLGVYATSNGGNGTVEAYVSRWRYIPHGQIVDYGVIVPSRWE
ncbi:xylosidase : arabinofuranosidase [Aspergillus karnatakaensis]|uniref:glycoside hydrolase family 43 protein n=1 Tax=Aspergillus karnatakaensis TaxID=1810916 RepID=UPI003CCCD4CC